MIISNGSQKYIKKTKLRNSYAIKANPRNRICHFEDKFYLFEVQISGLSRFSDQLTTHRLAL
jgi:hypothetical protein